MVLLLAALVDLSCKCTASGHMSLAHVSRPATEGLMRERHGKDTLRLYPSLRCIPL